MNLGNEGMGEFGNVDDEDPNEDKLWANGVMYVGDGRAEAEAALERAAELVRLTGARSFEPQILVERGCLAALRSDVAGAQESLRRAQGLFAEMGALGRAAVVARLIEQSLG